MRIRFTASLLAFLIGLVVTAPSTQAQMVSPTPTATTTTVVSPNPIATVSPDGTLADDTVKPTDLEATNTPWLTRLTRVFQSRNSYGYINSTLVLANTDLKLALRFGQSTKASDQQRAVRFLSRYKTELAAVNDYFSTHPDITDARLLGLRDKLLADAALHSLALEDLSKIAVLQSTASLEQHNVQAKLLSLLKKQQKVDEKIATLTESVTKKQDGVTGKLTRKLRLLDNLSSAAAGDETLKLLIEDKQARLIAEAAGSISDDELNDLAEKTSNDGLRRLDALSQAASKAPAPAQAKLNAVIKKLEDKEIEKIAKEAEKQAEQSKKIQTTTDTSDNASVKTDINVTVNGETTAVTDDSESNEVKLTTTVTDSACGSNLTVSRGSRAKITTINQTASSLTYTIESFGGKSVKPTAQETIEFTPSKNGTYIISCSNGRTATLTVQ